MWCRNDNFVHTLCGAAATTLYTLYVVPQRQLRSIFSVLSFYFSFVLCVQYVMGGGWDLYIQSVTASALTARPAWEMTLLTLLTGPKSDFDRRQVP